MDFQKCFEILSNRQAQSEQERVSNLNSAGEALPLGTTCVPCSGGETDLLNYAPSTEAINKLELNGLNELDLLNIVTLVQSERRKIYRDYDELLLKLIENSDISSYSMVCNEVTGVFSFLSQKVLAVKEIWNQRNLSKEATQLIDKIQGLEKEKLLLTAAHHLEIIRNAFPLMNTFGGIIENHTVDLSTKSTTIDAKLSELSEELQCLKTDYAS